MKMKVALLAVAIVAAAMIQPAFAADHACCSSAPAAGAAQTAKSEAPAKSDEAIIAEQKASYPLDTCVVLGGKLGEHGPAVDYVYKGRLVRFCCRGCIATFEKDPQKYLSKIDAAAKEKAKSKADTKTEAGRAASKPAVHVNPR